MLGYPCNQFGGQEPHCEADILRFTKEAYAVSFPLFSKIDVNGPKAHPLYAWLKHVREEKHDWNPQRIPVSRH